MRGTAEGDSSWDFKRGQSMPHTMSTLSLFFKFLLNFEHLTEGLPFRVLIILLFE
jgi:hypothetical protein